MSGHAGPLPSAPLRLPPLRSLLPIASLLVLIGAIAIIRPNAISYFGFNLMLNLALPIAFATIAQLCVITVNDLDLSIGSFVSFVACIAATVLHDEPRRNRDPDRRDRRLCRDRRADPGAQPAVHRRHPRHVVRPGSGPR